MTMELYEYGKATPEETFRISSRKVAAERRRIWMKKVKNLPDRYYIIIKIGTRNDKV